MKYFWRTFILGFFVIILINLWIDKDYRFFRRSIREGRNLQAGECLTLGNLESDRLAKQEIRPYLEKPDVLFLGSSRVSYLDLETVKPELKFYNGNFSIGLLEDYMAVWQELKSTQRIPGHMIIFLDHWAFNKKNRFRAWESIPALKDYLNQQGIKTPLFEKPWRRYTELQYKRLTDILLGLISFDYFKESLVKYYQAGIGEPYISCSKIEKESKAFLVHDGHAIYPFQHPTREEVLKEAQNFDGALQYSDPWVVNHELLDYFKIFLKDAKNLGVKITLVAPLWHPASWKMIQAAAHGQKVSKEYFAIIENLGKEAGVSTCIEPDSAMVGCNESEFVDGIHMNRECSLKLIKYCSQTNENLRIILR